MPLARRVEREIYDRPVRERVNNRNIEEKILASLFLSIAFIRLCFYHLSAFCKQKVRGLFCTVMNGLVKFLFEYFLDNSWHLFIRGGIALDKAPRLRIRMVILILSSDTGDLVI